MGDDEPDRPADAHARQRVVATPRQLVDALALHAQDGRDMVGVDERLAQVDRAEDVEN